MKQPDVFDNVVVQAMDGYQWNARKRKSPVNLTAMAATLLRAQHRKVRKIIEKARKASALRRHSKQETAIYNELTKLLARLDAMARKGNK